MEKLNITFNVITPLFMRGAKANRAELRGASIKGAMRFWYRAVDGAYRDNEGKIFGGAGEKGGQASFLLKVRQTGLKTETWTRKNARISYFAFPFEMEAGTEDQEPTNHGYIEPPGKLQLEILFKKNTTNDPLYRRAVLSSLWLLGHLGGLGSRSRRGFGTIALESWSMPESASWPEITELPIAHHATDLEEWQQSFSQGLNLIRQWFPKHNLPTHTIIDESSKFFLSDKGYGLKPGEAYCKQAFGNSARVMQEFRKENGPKEPKLKEIAKTMSRNPARINIEQVQKDITTPENTRFGLPLTYRYGQGKNIPEISFQGTDKERSASPIWVRIIKIGDRYYPFYAFLSAPLLPKGEQIGVKGLSGIELPKPSDQILVKFQEHLRKKSYWEVKVN